MGFAGLELGRWYPELTNCISIAVTEKRTRSEIEGLAAAYVKEMGERQAIA